MPLLASYSPSAREAVSGSPEGGRMIALIVLAVVVAVLAPFGLMALTPLKSGQCRDDETPGGVLTCELKSRCPLLPVRVRDVAQRRSSSTSA
jgi:hypothetical protein